MQLDDLCFATFTKNLKIALSEPTSDEELVRTLLNCILLSVDIKNRNGNPFDISKSLASDYLNRKRSIPREIQKAASSDSVKNTSEQYFSEYVISMIDELRLDDLIDAQTKLLEGDPDLPKRAAKKILTAKDSGVAYFLSQLFLFSLTRPNKRNKPQEVPTAPSNKFTESDLVVINQKLALMEVPERLIPPDQIADDELRYISELLAAYADATGKDVLTQEDLFSDPDLKKFKKDFSRQRKDFYAAETIRRASRDSLAERGVQAFQALKDETYAGIEEMLDDYYDNGFQRLKAVMDRVGILTLTKSMLLKIPNWVGIEERKGICHFLVNDGEVQWVDADD